VKHGRCLEHQLVYEQQRRPAWVTTHYNSTPWKKVRAMKKRANPLCQDCLDEGKITPTQEIDHVIPLTVRPDLALVMENLRSLCVECHRAKTRGETST
jgi:5-methylcytosine-specific restriction protein A